FLGVHKEEKHTRSAGKAAAGAIVGGVLTGGVGAIAGAAIGGRKKDASTFWIDFVDYEMKQEFSVQVKPNKKMSKNEISEFRPANPVISFLLIFKNEISEFRPANPVEIGLDD